MRDGQSFSLLQLVMKSDLKMLSHFTSVAAFCVLLLSTSYTRIINLYVSVVISVLLICNLASL